MNWDVIVKVGDSDNFAPKSQGEAAFNMSFDRQGDPFLSRERILDKIAEAVGSTPSNNARDLLRVAIAVYSADLLISRRYAGDGWTRNINVYLPVTSLAAWQEIATVLTKLLTFLSGDRWQFYFRELSVEQDAGREIFRNRPEAVSLFSGGIDSLIGAIDLLEEGKRLALVAHHGGGSTPKFQKNLFKCLEEEYGEQVIPLQFYVLPPQVPRTYSDLGNEETTRTRSFLYFALGIAVADALGIGIPLYVAENGFISLNVPLTPARIGSCSTRTTHPYYVALYRELLQALELSHSINLDYRFKTKGEMIRESKNQDLLKRTLPLSMSCAHPDNRRRMHLTPGAHCGYCFPCIIRQAAIFKSGIRDVLYDHDIFNLPPLSKSSKGKDLRAIEIALERFSQRGDRKAVFDVLSSGPIPPDELSQYIGVYCQGMKEIAKLVRSNIGG